MAENECIESEHAALGSVVTEILRQRKMYGDQTHLPDGTLRPGDPAAEIRAKEACENATASGVVTWRDILAEEVAEVNTATTDEAMLDELAQVAAVACSWMSAIMRRAKKA